MSIISNLQALSQYYALVESELDRKLYRVKRHSKKLHQIYEAIKPKEVVKKQEPKDDLLVKQTLAKLTGEELPEVKEEKVEITNYDLFKQELAKFKQSPALFRSKISEKFVNQLYQISKPTTVHVQTRIIENLDYIIQELQQLHKENTADAHSVYKYQLMRNCVNTVIAKYKQICEDYQATKQVDELFPESPYTNKEEDQDKESEYENDIFSSPSVARKDLARLYSVRNDARLAVMKYRLQRRGSQILIPLINPNPQNIEEARDSCIAAKIATSLVSQPNKNWLIVYNQEE
ncbi:hypothetical protein TVAG_213310 [Trichomonas vaginalis G3]|uniref:Uncharacterized protein n=1 Tax=Trichomonas vaginalis (strain ATCC PRA-98 / G3) TaxID=412133 RepID=A2EEV6_TRIV3|nr:hypothetical protein TVAGG3_0061590 [Trichomonas vaginalis G3]EAY08822.1 hypothetical protein TVAG_213310 [Trichomonas vaginalis G3]KAI5542049.1 hypothetical protein TVAGG3_0061590 [Trichomonas vaginalis G3]|eukprot:XP_001321045.1 hypothetical protein [Trichomonas vaginalis G3]